MMSRSSIRSQYYQFELSALNVRCFELCQATGAARLVIYAG